MTAPSRATRPDGGIELATARLAIVPPDHRDAAALDAILRLDAVAWPLTVTRAMAPADRGGFAAWSQGDDAADAPRRPHLFAIRLRPDGPTIGGMKLVDDHLSYFLDPASWHLGLASEAVGALCTAAGRDLGLRRVEAVALRDNVASCRLLERLGFRPRGLRQRLPGPGGARMANVLYALDLR